MGIVDEDIVALREATDIVSVITKYTQLRRVGTRWVGLCPFHAEKTPSFNVNQELGLYRCWGCQVRGDVITFVREMEHLDFVGAVELLAGWGGMTLRYSDKDEGASRKRRQRLVQAVEQAVDWYHERLLSAPDAAVARKYLRERGLTGDEVRAFRIGWAPEGWDTMVKALRLPDDVVRDSGLGYLNRNDRQTDAFRGRILFPIFDANGDAVGFGGRVMPGGEGPKYKNTPETALYQKSKLLYALNWSKARIVTDDRAIVCEGYTDVIGFARAGLPAAVATCGTALTNDHIRLLRRYARKLVLAFDADAAGQGAAERIYAWERQLDLDVAVARLPAGQDPGDLARTDPEALRRAVDEAEPFLRFRLGRVFDRARLDSPEGRARAAREAMAVVGEHPDAGVRDGYTLEVAAQTRLDPERLRHLDVPEPAGARPAPAPRGRVVAVDRGPSDRPRSPGGPEVEALRLLVLDHDAVAPLLDEVLFDDGRCLAAYRALRASSGDVGAALADADPGAAELLHRLAVEDSDADPGDVTDLLLEAAARRELAVLQAQARTAEDPLAYADLVRWVKLQLEALRRPAAGESARGQLLGWLAGQHEEPA